MDIKRTAALLCSALMLCMGSTACSQQADKQESSSSAVSDTFSYVFDFSDFKEFELSSSDLHDGVWDTVITTTANGSNRSPQLSWAPVEGAGCYAIFMVDTTAGNWLHWKSVSESETELPAGWAPENEYKGPYPPSGTHNYEVYVFALKQAPERIKGGFDASNEKMYDFMKELDGDSGNIISYGHILGTYTYGD